MNNKTVLFDQHSSPPETPHASQMVKIREQKPDKETPISTKNVSPVLYRAKGVWPFDFVPDEFIVEEQRLVLITNHFPFGCYIGTMTMDKLSSIEVSQSLFFSSITLESSELHGFNAKFNWLTNKDAHCIKEIVDGLKVKELANVEIPQTKPSNISKTLESMGHI